MRFHLDENMTPKIARALAARGIDVTHPADVGLVAADDVDQLAYCRRTERVLITGDEDFLILHSAGTPHAGILFFVQERISFKRVIEMTMLVHLSCDAGDMTGCVEYG